MNLVAESLGETLVADLSADMEKTIEDADRSITFMVENSPDKPLRDQVVVEIQVWSFAFTDEGKRFALENGCPVKLRPSSYVEWMARKYPWPARTDPVPSWRGRLRALASERNPHRALKKYRDFLRQTDELRSKITEAAGQLDRFIQMQIDIARGK